MLEIALETDFDGGADHPGIEIVAVADPAIADLLVEVDIGAVCVEFYARGKGV